MSDLLLQSGLHNRNKLKLSMDSEGDMTLFLDAYGSSFHIESQDQIRQLRDYFQSYLIEQSATGAQVTDEMVQRALSAWYISRETNELGLMRAALEAALAQEKAE